MPNADLEMIAFQSTLPGFLFAAAITAAWTGTVALVAGTLIADRPDPPARTSARRGSAGRLADRIPLGTLALNQAIDAAFTLYRFGRGDVLEDMLRTLAGARGLMLVAAVLIVGALSAGCEELFFRGYVQRWLVARLGPVPGSSSRPSCSALAHWDWHHSLFAFAFGVFRRLSPRGWPTACGPRSPRTWSTTTVSVVTLVPGSRSRLGSRCGHGVLVTVFATVWILRRHSPAGPRSRPPTREDPGPPARRREERRGADRLRRGRALLREFPLAPAYFGTLHLELFGLTVLHWINDLLMAGFFFVVGMEIKREFRFGRTGGSRSARCVPIAGVRLAGMIRSRGDLRWRSNDGRSGSARLGASRWRPDIAFSLGVLALLGPRVPRGLTVFLAPSRSRTTSEPWLVIAVFYTASLQVASLLGALVLVVVLAVLARWRRLWPYAVACRAAVDADARLGSSTRPSRASSWDGRCPCTPLRKLEHAMKPWVTWFVMPVFALANAGVTLAPGVTLAHPVAWVSGLGLLVGKPLGIVGLSWLLVRFRLAELPRGATWPQLAGVGMIAGIGFTVALFVASVVVPG
jgi:NhaA family Na+:H+ antiporter